MPGLEWQRFFRVDEVIECFPLSLAAHKLQVQGGRKVIERALLQAAPHCYRWTVKLSTAWRVLPAPTKTAVEAAYRLWLDDVAVLEPR